jgi:hypothetical protein
MRNSCVSSHLVFKFFLSSSGIKLTEVGCKARTFLSPEMFSVQHGLGFPFAVHAHSSVTGVLHTVTASYEAQCYLTDMSYLSAIRIAFFQRGTNSGSSSIHIPCHFFNLPIIHDKNTCQFHKYAMWPGWEDCIKPGEYPGKWPHIFSTHGTLTWTWDGIHTP